MSLLEVENLVAGYGRIQILHGLSIHLGDNERIGLFGPNGHGKTTLLCTISGLLRPWHGDIRFRGQSIIGRSPKHIVEAGLVHVAQGSVLFPRMTVYENLMMGAYCRRAWPERQHSMEYVFDLFPRLAERRHQLCRSLSGGERQMLAIGMGLMGKGQLLMFDELTLGLAPKLKEELGAAIRRIADTGVPMIIVEQDIDFLLSLTERLYLIEEGRVVLEQRKGEHRLDHRQIMQMYFGGSGAGRLLG